jgi:methylenetetrahydrofolate--tRNA-(uracil-5-)-methyltransferase
VGGWEPGRREKLTPVTVVGAGFAGVEAAWTLARLGFPVRLFEMRPVQMTPAHTTSHFAELVCSNSFKSNDPTSPAGQLKAEMRGLGSLILEIAERHSVPGGSALAVDRDAFATDLTQTVESHPNIEIRREPFTAEMANPADGPLILATGPLTSPDLSEWLAKLTGREHLYFFDAVSPTVSAESLNRNIVFGQSRYDKGEGADYLNCPFEKSHYEEFVQALITAERAPFHAFEAGGKRDLPGQEYSEEEFLKTVKYFAGCMPIEAIAERGKDSLRFGNYKPVGLIDPRSGRRPYAALQLRPENREETLYSLVASQTRLKWGEQKRIFRMIPGLEQAEFVRFGVIHRNTYLEAPKSLSSELEMLDCPNLYISGQLTGVEGYVESAAMGLYSGWVLAHRLTEKPFPVAPRETAYGSLISHLQDQTPREFAPMNINWGLLPEPPTSDPPPKKRDKGLVRTQKIERARNAFAEWRSQFEVKEHA